MTVVYVDDDQDDLDIFKEAIKLVSGNITLYTFLNCAALISFLRSGTTLPCYIFIDINMPKIGGYECARAVRNLSDGHIIFISTSFNASQQKDFLLEDVSYMIKSPTITEMAQDLTQLLTSETHSKDFNFQ